MNNNYPNDINEINDISHDVENHHNNGNDNDNTHDNSAYDDAHDDTAQEAVATEKHIDYSTILEAYSNLQTNSFVPYIKDNKLTIFYTDMEGEHRANIFKFVHKLHDTSLELTTKEHLYELIEQNSFGLDDMQYEGQNSEDIDDIDESNILFSSYEDAPIIKLVNNILIDASKSRASDIHIEAGANSLMIRYRIDGNLHLIKQYPKNIHESILARIKVLASLDVAETRKSQDGRINIKIGNREIDIRVSTVNSINGEKAVMRILEQTRGVFDLAEIGMDAELLALYAPLLRRTSGIILVSGPTGSGKSTTLYASLKRVDRENKNVLTIEDPVEYTMEGVTQVQVNNAIGLNFASAIRTFLRQDPDVILVGEIRDEETAQASIQASLTGHLVLSTIHTNDAPTTISRLIDMEIEPFLISSALSAVIGQRLVRKICQYCKHEVETPKDLRALFEEHGVTLERHFEGTGCPECHGTGYSGRIGVYELLIINDKLRHLINQNSPAVELKREAIASAGYKPMLVNGVKLLTSGLTTPSELYAITNI